MDQFEKEGFLVLKGVIDEGNIHRLERGAANNPPLDGTLDPNAPKYPAPGRYPWPVNRLARAPKVFVRDNADDQVTIFCDDRLEPSYSGRVHSLCALLLARY